MVVRNTNPTLSHTPKESYTIEDLFIASIENTERLAIRKESISQANSKKETFFSQFFPTLSFRYQQFATLPDHTNHDREIRNRNNRINALSNEIYGTGISTPYDASNVLNSGSSASNSTSPLVRPGSRLVLRIPLFTGFNEYANYKSSKFEVKLRHLELKHDAGRIYLEIAQAYYNFLQMESHLKSRKEILKLTIASKSEMSKRVRLGRNRASDLLAINSQISRLEAEILGITDNYNQLKDSLSFLTGLNSEILLAKEEIPTIPPILDELEKKMEIRHDIEAAKINVEIAKSEVLKAYGGHFPTASIDTFYTFPSGNSPSNTKDLFNQLVIQVPILSFGTVKSAVQQAESMQKQMELQLKQTIRFAREEIKKAHNSYKHSLEMERSYKTALESSEVFLKTISKDYSNKSASELDLLNAQIAVWNAREDLLKMTLQKDLNLIWLKVATDESPSPSLLEKINKTFSLIN